jgi:hypothetical protein
MLKSVPLVLSDQPLTGAHNQMAHKRSMIESVSVWSRLCRDHWSSQWLTMANVTKTVALLRANPVLSCLGYIESFEFGYSV